MLSRWRRGRRRGDECIYTSTCADTAPSTPSFHYPTRNHLQSPNKYIGYIAKAFLEAAKANPRIKLALFVHKLDHFATDPDTYRR